MYVIYLFCHFILLKKHISFLSTLSEECYQCLRNWCAPVHSLMSLINFGFPTHLLSILSPEVVGELSLRLKRISFGFNGTKVCGREAISCPWGEIWASSTCEWVNWSVWWDMFKELFFWLVFRAFEILQGIAINTQETSNVGHSVLHYPNSTCQGPYFRKESLLISDSSQWLSKPGFC